MHKKMHPWIRLIESAGEDGGGFEDSGIPEGWDSFEDDGEGDSNEGDFDEDRGYPENTPLDDMSLEEQVAYWKHNSRKHEGRVKAFGDITPEALSDMREKSEKYEALEYELTSEQDKAIAAAREEAAKQARSELLPQLVQASFDSHAARLGVDSEKLNAALKYVDLNKFLTSKGQVDTEAVASYVGTMRPEEPELPSYASGIGFGALGYGGFLPGERGRAEAQRRFNKN